MSDKKSFYITTTLPYVNADPHIGFAMELIHADVIARAKKLQGHEVFFNTGTDEHGQKIFEAAQKAGKDVQEYVDYYAGKFEELKKALNLSNDTFIRTTDEHHVRAAQEIWNRCKANGDIYEKEFEGLYCVGCERFLSQRDIVDGKCNIHKWATPEVLKEKNWFFRFNKYEKELLEYLSNPKSVIPDWRREEAINFIKEGLEDFSISRDKSKLSWGIPVPDDDTQVMYVWFDALTNYISTLGWPDEGGNFQKFWVDGYTMQFAGKDQVRFQSLMWQAMLISAGIKNTNTVFYHGFINSGGQKMSKSLGNVISPFELVEKYGTDATRYLLLRHVHSTEDTDVTWEKLNEWYKAGLPKGVGNALSRVLTLCDKNGVGLSENDFERQKINARQVLIDIDSCNLNTVLDRTWSLVRNIDVGVDTLITLKLLQSNSENAKRELRVYLNYLVEIAYRLEAFMPETSKKMLELIKVGRKPEVPLFPSLNA